MKSKIQNISLTKIFPYLLTIPIILLLGIFVAYPLLKGVYLSFTDFRFGQLPVFVGIKNYLNLFQSSSFYIAFRNSMVYTFATVTFKLIFGLIMALVLNRSYRGRSFLRGFFIVPWVVPTIVTASIFYWMFSNMGGVANYILQSVHLVSSPIPWLSRPNLAMSVVIMANIWRGVPFFGVNILAGLQTINRDLLEAAKIDGANAWQRFIHIIIPEVKSVILIVTILSIVWTFGDFQLIYVITKGGPGMSTHVIPTYTHQLAYLAMNPGMGIAASLTLVPVMLFFILFFVRYAEERY